MFETTGDAGVVEAIAVAAREQNAACGRELIAIGELYARRAPEDDVERTCWAIDGHANVVAEVSAALNISRGRASGLLDRAIALRERLPKLAEVLASGVILLRMMAALVMPSLRTNSYFVATVGGVRLSVVKRYVETQKDR